MSASSTNVRNWGEDNRTLTANHSDRPEAGFPASGAPPYQ